MAYKTYKRYSKLKKQDPSDYSYERKFDLVTPTELEFFHTLQSSVNKEYYYIVPQVHLSTLFKHKIKGQNWYGAFQHINRKSVDFAICTLKGLNPVCAIELDDESHSRLKTVKRDKRVEELFRQADLPLLRISVHEMRDTESLKLKLSQIPVPGIFTF